MKLEQPVNSPKSKQMWSTKGLSLRYKAVLTSFDPCPLDTSIAQENGCSLMNNKHIFIYTYKSHCAVQYILHKLEKLYRENLIVYKKCSKYSLLIKVANKCRLNLQLEDMVLIIVG